MTIPERLKEKLRNLPDQPGIYKFFNSDGKIIYIGKAKKLKNRVTSYFNSSRLTNRKTKNLSEEISDLEYVLVNHEYDALLLENNLIKENQPKYNIMLRDDKSYPFICVPNEDFPRVFSTREKRNPNSKYFGPYTSVKKMKSILQLIRQLYTIRSCNLNLSPQNIEKKKYKVCLEYHIKNCKGPCEGLQTQENYDIDIKQVTNILKGNFSQVKEYFTIMVSEAAEKLEFEKAAFYKNKLDIIDNFQQKSLVHGPDVKDLEVYTITSSEKYFYINYVLISQGHIFQTESLEIKRQLEESEEDVLAQIIVSLRNKFEFFAPRILSNKQIDTDLPGSEYVVPKIGDTKKMVELSFKNCMYYKAEKERERFAKKVEKAENPAVEQLKIDLNLKETPIHIECFDNSNIQGTNPVSAMVCFRNGKPSKKDYRHYKIKTVIGPDDFASMYEVVTRRYTRLVNENQPLPQLIIIDGGKGQLSAAVDALKDINLYGKMGIIGIAKKLEEIYVPGDTLPLHISKKSLSLKLIQQLRNEAHRFGITFHRALRSKASLQSSLTEVEGIGPKTYQTLIKHFKSIKKLAEASEVEVIAVIGKAKAKIVLEAIEKLK